jgi:hypothetical protein
MTHQERWGLLVCENEEEKGPASYQPLIPTPPTPQFAAVGKAKARTKVNARTKIAPASPSPRAINADDVDTPMRPPQSASSYRTPRRTLSSSAAPMSPSEATPSAPVPILGLSRRAARFLLSISLHAMAEGFGAFAACLLLRCHCFLFRVACLLFRGRCSLNALQ